MNSNAAVFHAAGSALPVPDNTAFLLKLTPRGKLAWIDTFDPFSQDAAAIVADASGVYVAGYSDGADLNPARAKTCILPEWSGYLAKYSSAGALTFARSLSDEVSVEPGRMALDPVSGNVLVAGTFTDSANLNPTGSVFRVDGNGGVDAFLARYDRNGAFLTAASFGSSQDEDVPALAISAGHLFVAGKLSREIDFEPGPGERLLIAADDPFGHQAGYLVAYAWS